MFKFIHGYDKHFLRGLEKRGLLTDNIGVKLMHNFPIPDKEKFNIAAARGTELYSLIKENKYMFLIDRMQGGTFYHKYNFDRSLINEYSEMLGEEFLGIQIHEMGSVLNGDWKRIRKQMGDIPPPWSPKQIHDAILKVSACKWCIHLSCGTAEEYSEKTYPETWRDYSRAMEELFLKRQSETGGYLISSNSFLMSTGMEYRLGVRTVMPEVGAQLSLVRLQIALARGMSKAFGRIWGAYYEPWGGESLSAPHYFTEGFNEWRLDNSNFPHDFTSNGENGGSSRVLQSRIYHYLLMSGAKYLAEEWGTTNTFYDWTDYELTPYGKVKKEFIDFSEKMQDVEAYIPFAVILPRSFEAVDLGYIANPDRQEYVGRILTGTLKESFENIRKILALIYVRNGKIYGNEGHAITNSRFGDFFDVIYDDLNSEVYKKYDCLVDATYGNAFSRSDTATGLNVLAGSDIELLADEVNRLIGKKSPCVVSGEVHWMLSRGNDKWFLSIFNNEGVGRSAAKGDYLIREADKDAEIVFRQIPANLNVIASLNGNIEKKDGNTFISTVKAGGFLILEFI
ncbi:MAG: hypothetical protein A2017_03650 [Lentisphaerae bacterium GWF2_44_16]|nr:MAG: hypothetical protein A2017_03650 [Lentisphaerae bacterium GWF2_44_16]